MEYKKTQYKDDFKVAYIFGEQKTDPNIQNDSGWKRFSLDLFHHKEINKKSISNEEVDELYKVSRSSENLLNFKINHSSIKEAESTTSQEHPAYYANILRNLMLAVVEETRELKNMINNFDFID